MLEIEPQSFTATFYAINIQPALNNHQEHLHANNKLAKIMLFTFGELQIR